MTHVHWGRNRVGETGEIVNHDRNDLGEGVGLMLIISKTLQKRY